MKIWYIYAYDPESEHPIALFFSESKARKEQKRLDAIFREKTTEREFVEFCIDQITDEKFNECEPQSAKYYKARDQYKGALLNDCWELDREFPDTYGVDPRWGYIEDSNIGLSYFETEDEPGDAQSITDMEWHLEPHEMGF